MECPGCHAQGHCARKGTFMLAGACDAHEALPMRRCLNGVSVRASPPVRPGDRNPQAASYSVRTKATHPWDTLPDVGDWSNTRDGGEVICEVCWRSTAGLCSRQLRVLSPPNWASKVAHPGPMAWPGCGVLASMVGRSKYGFERTTVTTQCCRLWPWCCGSVSQGLRPGLPGFEASLCHWCSVCGL